MFSDLILLKNFPIIIFSIKWTVVAIFTLEKILINDLKKKDVMHQCFILYSRIALIGWTY